MSTEEQAERGLSLGAQRETCRAYAERTGWQVSAEWPDEGISAGKPLHKRPGLVQAIAALASGDILLVAKRDRLFRADPFECALIERAIASRGARIVSVAGEGTDDDSPSSVLMRRILDAMAEYERLLASVRTKAIVEAKRARGERLGQVPYGWRVGKDGKTLEIDPGEQGAICLIRERTNEGKSLRAIAQELDERGFPPKRGTQWRASSVTHPVGASNLTLDLIWCLQGTGLSPRQIASELNRRGIPDRRPAKWSATCVARILESCPPVRV